MTDNITFFIWSNAESLVTIIAADIAMLRVLGREVKTRQYHGTSIDVATTARRINLRSQTNTVAAGPRLRLDKQVKKSILDSKASPAEKGL
jgi:hypothetical protein